MPTINGYACNYDDSRRLPHSMRRRPLLDLESATDTRLFFVNKLIPLRIGAYLAGDWPGAIRDLFPTTEEDC